MVNIKQSIAILIFTLLGLSACGGGGGGGGGGGNADAKGSNWDQMLWDQDNWS